MASAKTKNVMSLAGAEAESTTWSDVPLTITELLQLTNVNVPLHQVTWPRVVMTSDKWICVRHDNGESHRRHNRKLQKGHCFATILNPYSGGFPYTWYAIADSIAMNPVHSQIALKAEHRFQVFTVQDRKLLYKLKLEEPVHYWTWIRDDVIAIVTSQCVYHWCLSHGSKLYKMFSRHKRLKCCEIVSYKADSQLRWLALTGLCPTQYGSECIQGVTQLYSVHLNLTQCVDGHACCFADYRFEDNPHPSTVFCLACREIQQEELTGARAAAAQQRKQIKVHVVELGPAVAGNLAPSTRSDGFDLPNKETKSSFDFPVSMQVSLRYGLLYVATKFGQLAICDLEGGTYLLRAQISEAIIFTTALNTENQGILAINRLGQVIAVELKMARLIAYLQTTSKRPKVAKRLQEIQDRASAAGVNTCTTASATVCSSTSAGLATVGTSSSGGFSRTSKLSSVSSADRTEREISTFSESSSSALPAAGSSSASGRHVTGRAASRGRSEAVT